MYIILGGGGGCMSTTGLRQGLRQDLETGCPKLTIVKKRPIFQGTQQYTQITTINMYLLIESYLLNRIICVSWGVTFVGFGAQMTPTCPMV